MNWTTYFTDHGIEYIESRQHRQLSIISVPYSAEAGGDNCNAGTRQLGGQFTVSRWSTCLAQHDDEELEQKGA
jgi:hypothetical protein